MSKRITLQNILPFVLSGVLVKKSQCEYSLKFQSNWSISYKRKNFERETVCVKFWKFCDSIYITKHSNKRARSKMFTVWCMWRFLLKFNLFLLTPSCKCNLECLYTRVYSWSLWYQIIQLSSQIDTSFSFSPCYTNFILKTFNTLFPMEAFMIS